MTKTFDNLSYINRDTPEVIGCHSKTTQINEAKLTLFNYIKIINLQNLFRTD